MNNLPWGIAIIGGLVAKWDAISHKQLLLIAGAIISILVYWGFNQTFDRMATDRELTNKQFSKIEKKQDETIMELKHARITEEERNGRQDTCIAEIKAKQEGVLRTLEDLKSLHKEKH